MTTNPIVALRNSVSNVFDLDRQTQHELVTHTNRMQAQAELAREAINTISQIVVYSEYQVAQALITTKAIEDGLVAAGVPEEEYLAYNRMLRHEYLQKMAAVAHQATNAVSQQVG